MMKVFMASLVLFLASPAMAQTLTSHTVTVTWTNPVTRTDGTALAPSEIANVEVHDTVNNSMTAYGFGTAPSPFTTPPLVAGTHTFTMMWTDTLGQKSVESNAIQVQVPQTTPVAPPSAGVLNSATVN
jgi:hypothetical protein